MGGDLVAQRLEVVALRGLGRSGAPLGQPADRRGVDQVSSDGVSDSADGGEFLGQLLERLTPARDENDGMAISRVRMRDGLAKTRTCSEHGD